MTKYIQTAVFVVMLVGKACNAQSTTNWGQSVNGVRIAISTTTNVVSLGSVVAVKAQIENTSTNTVTIIETASWKDFSVWLEDALGKKYMLTDNSKAINQDRNFVKKIRPSEVDEWEIRLTISDGIRIGQYTMKATRRIKFNGGVFVVESNPLAILVK